MFRTGLTATPADCLTVYPHFKCYESVFEILKLLNVQFHLDIFKKNCFVHRREAAGLTDKSVWDRLNLNESQGESRGRAHGGQFPCRQKRWWSYQIRKESIGSSGTAVYFLEYFWLLWLCLSGDGPAAEVRAEAADTAEVPGEAVTTAAAPHPAAIWRGIFFSGWMLLSLPAAEQSRLQ